MKRLITAILAFIYMGTSVGATMHLHYCMDKLVGWSLSKVEQKSCAECGMKKALVKTGSCCSDDEQVIKHSIDQKAAETSFQAIHFTAAAIPSGYVDAPADPIVSLTEAHPLTNGPPKAASVAIYLRNRTFLI
jgi:hypothetical protein